MAKRTKKDYTAKQKFQIVLECLTSDKEDTKIARSYGVHPTSLSKWKRRFLESGAEIFSGNETVKTYEKKVAQLERLTENLASWVNIGALVFGWQPFSTTNINGWSLGNPFIWHIDEPKDHKFFIQWQDTGMSGLVGHVRVLAFKGLKNLLEKVGFKNVKVYTKGYLPFQGKLSDFLCYIDRRHGHFLIATGSK